MVHFLKGAAYHSKKMTREETKMKCVACLKELATKELLYSEHKEVYCANPFTCNDHHPNSVSNIVARKGAVKMFTEDELKQDLFEKLDVPEELKERIIKTASKPQSIRLSRPEFAYYLIDLQERRDLVSLSEAVRYCIQLAMNEDPMPTKQSKGEPTTLVPAPEPVSEGIKFVVPDVPEVSKSVNVDWDLVKTQAKEKQADKKPKEDEDETFVF
jgi:hypothetical protein